MPAGNSLLDFPSGDDFILITTRYCGLDGVLFDDEQNDMPLDATANLFILF